MTNQPSEICVFALAVLSIAAVQAQSGAAKSSLRGPVDEPRSEERGVARAGNAGGVRLGQEPLAEAGRKRGERGGLVDRSTIISHGEHWTMVPKGAVLHVPASLEARVGGAPTGRLLSWKAFYARNRSWLLQQPVDVSQARGVKRLGEELVKSITSRSRIVVATCRNGPIAMKKPLLPGHVSR